MLELILIGLILHGLSQYAALYIQIKTLLSYTDTPQAEAVYILKWMSWNASHDLNCYRYPPTRSRYTSYTDGLKYMPIRTCLLMLKEFLNGFLVSESEF